MTAERHLEQIVAEHATPIGEFRDVVNFPAKKRNPPV